MTKFQNPSFSSPANNESYSSNYDRSFGKLCGYRDENGELCCDKLKWYGKSLCYEHLEAIGIVPEKPETD